ncbi:hypothetical protein [Geomicrobium sp. JCM 19037]|uniref:hypothetical protein n=1 Tax=Geomicrobium sp. JCM 19037 TaxID=1460634 RepID=UPI000694EFE4|nr:hypothetical protein [Geomicrobium sp. JCM 19037]
MHDNAFKHIDLVIFDLDGTLYEDTDHFDHYAKRLSEELPEQKRANFFQDYDDMKKGNHAVPSAKRTTLCETGSLKPIPLQAKSAA